jgi:subtilase family serine protease
MNSIEKTIKKMQKKYNCVQKSQYKLSKNYTKKHKKEKIIAITYATSDNYTTTPINTNEESMNVLANNELANNELANSVVSLYNKFNGECDIQVDAQVDKQGTNPTPKATTAPIYYTPNQIVSAYGLDKLNISKRGKGITIGVVIAYHYPNLMVDLNMYSIRFGLPTTTSGQFVFRVISNTNRVNIGWAQECCLDVQAIHCVAPYANILVVEAKTNSYADMLNATKIAVSSGASVISMSWGGEENSSVISSYDAYFKTVPNVCFLAASGDASNKVIYPSSSPYVLSVGGTNLKLNSNNTRKQETPWYNSANSGAGNGFSKYITRPVFQLGIDDITINKRCTPDLSLLADPTTGFVVCYAGRYYIYGGTSLATPLCAGIIAIANQIRKTPLTTNITYTKGEVHNFIYQTIYKNKAIYTSANPYSGNFYDVTIGKNGIYSANLGYDVASGLGSLNANIICNSLAIA